MNVKNDVKLYQTTLNFMTGKWVQMSLNIKHLGGESISSLPIQIWKISSVATRSEWMNTYTHFQVWFREVRIKKWSGQGYPLQVARIYQRKIGKYIGRNSERTSKWRGRRETWWTGDSFRFSRVRETPESMSWQPEAVSTINTTTRTSCHRNPIEWNVVSLAVTITTSSPTSILTTVTQPSTITNDTITSSITSVVWKVCAFSFKSSITTSLATYDDTITSLTTCCDTLAPLTMSTNDSS